MKVILLKDIKNLGEKYSIKEVSDGYARNYLLPKKLAIVANEKNLAEIKKIKDAEIKKRQENLKKIDEIIDKLSKETIEFSLKVGKNGEIFGGINKKEIEKKLQEKFNYQNFEVKIEKPIKMIGECELKVKLGENKETNLKIKINPL